MDKRERWGYGALFLLITLSIGVFLSFGSGADNNFLKVYFFDVGQGDAIFIEAPNGSQVLLDGGPDKKVIGQLGKVMSLFDRTIDVLIVSNPDKDHIAGFIPVLDRYKVSSVIEPGTKQTTEVYEVLRQKVEDKKIPTLYARRGMKFVLDETRGIFLEVLFPDRDVSGLSSNDGSLVARLVYGETCFILQGDATSGIERHILSLGGDIGCQVLKAGHHGSYTSSDKKYVEAVSPEYAVISLGRDNRYGHPHKETLETFASLKIPILRTDELGSIKMFSDGKKLFLK